MKNSDRINRLLWVLFAAGIAAAWFAPLGLREPHNVYWRFATPLLVFWTATAIYCGIILILLARRIKDDDGDVTS
ncbi:MAG: hypothetical protein MK165_11780 [Pirellulaceae bacterium]|nr:hypothetical protein [Pirellulaceae bacterium]